MPEVRKRRVAKRRARGEDVVQAVLEATLSVLAEHGFAALRIEDVAARAKVNKTTIYRRWPAKNQLVAAAVSAGPAVSALPDTGALESDVREFLRLAATELPRDLGRSMLNLLVAERSHPEVADIVHFVDRTVRTLPRLMFERAVARGEMAPGTDIDVALGALIGSLYTRVVMEEQPLDERYIEQLTQLLMRGVALAPPATGGAGSRASARGAARGSAAPRSRRGR
ncbi:MAG: TetR/AcrR family transcriptional regulator [Sandaracinaceae bacterium]|nr:TetR/AcrR family transcriptional regulator [Sandaracinaceae bacterium]